jgi:flagellar biosynthesis/type III secretory pathway chaperone
MKELLDKLVRNLREELIQYGELLSLLEQQQELIINRSADGIMQNLTSIHAQMAEIAKARSCREQCREDAAESLGLEAELPIKEMYSSFPVEYQALVQALVDEVNELLIKANQRLRQNHLLLSRSLEFMQKLIQSLFPTQAGQTYDQSGQIGSAFVPQRTTYETLI